MAGALYHRINRPYYVFRPSQLWRRLRLSALEQRSVARLPWGLEIEFNTAESIGKRLATNGVLDLEVTEALFRLVEPGEIAVDAGANIGYMTSIMALCVGPRGRVLAFEPHPDVFQRLLANAERWDDDARTGTVSPRRTALGARAGSATLRTSESFASNEGSATLVTADGPVDGADVRLHEVELVRLDDAVSEEESVGVLKIDVEGGELGCSRALAGCSVTGASATSSSRSTAAIRRRQRSCSRASATRCCDPSTDCSVRGSHRRRCSLPDAGAATSACSRPLLRSGLSSGWPRAGGARSGGVAPMHDVMHAESFSGRDRRQLDTQGP
jgi:FkbM family methyltransferase